jgi:hypothetical protein
VIIESGLRLLRTRNDENSIRKPTECMSFSSIVLLLGYYCSLIFISMCNNLTYLVLVIQFGNNYSGHAVAQVVEALRYKPEGCGFDSRWCNRKFH